MHLTNEQRAAILDSLQEHFARRDISNVCAQAVQDDIDQHVWARQNTIEKLVIPWIETHQPLRALDVLEPGCGCGATTAAFAQTGCTLHSYEIDPIMVAAANARLGILGLSSDVYWLDLRLGNAELVRRYPTGVDAVLLMGIPEHIAEVPRLEFLACLWGLLRPNGILVICQTPNRLTYTDIHTAHAPFHHLLPDEIAIQYARHSPRDAYRESMAWAERQGHESWVTMRHEFGTALSFHDFEIAFGVDDLRPILADDGMGKEMMAWYGPTIEERLLWEYMQDKAVPVPKGFSRQMLNLIFRKPRG